jgi:phenylpropionate dioxygenase-like ring-hydroxylating dioxygenase large terminal subunit
MPVSLDTLHIDSDIARAWSVPAPFYTEPSVLALEQERIFGRTWQVVGHCHQLVKPGDFFTTELLGEPLLLVRAAAGELRGFYNVCRHRAGPPAVGCGSRKLFRCGYHGWTYGLDGSLISAPEFEGQSDFRPEQFSLVPVRSEEWFNLIFVNLDPNAQPLLKGLGELPKQTEGFKFVETLLATSPPEGPLPETLQATSLQGMRLFQRRNYEMKCNWKTYVDNYIEGYHLPSVHPGLNRELDYNAYTVETYARHVRQFSPIRGAQPGDATPRRYQDARENLTTDYFWIFPNWMLNCYPDNVSLNIVMPLGPERSLAIFEWYVLEKDLDSKVASDSVEFSHQIQVEDIAICETVQKNLHSRSYNRGRYSVKQEKGVHAFHRMYAEAMRG